MLYACSSTKAKQRLEGEEPDQTDQRPKEKPQNQKKQRKGLGANPGHKESQISQIPTYQHHHEEIMIVLPSSAMLATRLLHLAGYSSVSMDDIKQFRQWGSQTPGHPENFVTSGIEVRSSIQVRKKQRGLPEKRHGQATWRVREVQKSEEAPC